MSGLTKKEIPIVYERGKKFYTKFFTIFFLSSDELKYSIVVSKKISKKAVIRNKIKRRLRSICRSVLENGYVVVVVKKDVSEIDFKILENEFKKFFQKDN